MDFPYLIKSFAEEYKLDKLEPEPNGCVCLKLNDRECVIVPDRNGESLSITCELGMPPQDQAESLADLMMKMDFMLAGQGAAGVSINPYTGAYAISNRCSILHMGTGDFAQWLEDFLNTADTMAKLITVLQVPPAEAKPAV
ncbi:MAG: type III secretion system chaperone [Succinivibrio sp.]|nr:type III secretion system chaperone [Succinivibrio sp.]